jgi:hypothetical protein
MPILKAGVLYFGLVFGVGFVLGTIRTLWVVPRVGTRKAELMETPIMLVITIVAARWIILRLSVPSMGFARLEMGTRGLRSMLRTYPDFMSCSATVKQEFLQRVDNPVFHFVIGSQLAPTACSLAVSVTPPQPLYGLPTRTSRE